MLCSDLGPGGLLAVGSACWTLGCWFRGRRGPLGLRGPRGGLPPRRTCVGVALCGADSAGAWAAAVVAACSTVQKALVSLLLAAAEAASAAARKAAAATAAAALSAFAGLSFFFLRSFAV